MDIKRSCKVISLLVLFQIIGFESSASSHSDTYEEELARLRKNITTENYQMKIQEFLGTWMSCQVQKYTEKYDEKNWREIVWKLRSKGHYLTFSDDGRFTIYEVVFEDTSCEIEDRRYNPFLSFHGYFYLGEKINEKNYFEINMIYDDVVSTKNYNEEMVFFSIIGLVDGHLAFGRRNAGYNKRTPDQRPKDLDKKEFHYSPLNVRPLQATGNQTQSD